MILVRSNSKLWFTDQIVVQPQVGQVGKPPFTRFPRDVHQHQTRFSLAFELPCVHRITSPYLGYLYATICRVETHNILFIFLVTRLGTSWFQTVKLLASIMFHVRRAVAKKKKEMAKKALPTSCSSSSFHRTRPDRN